MKKIFTIARREFDSYFTSFIAYIAITVFVVITGVLVFFKGEFFERNEASLRVLFEWVPLIFLGYIPAITMRLISEEKRSGTIELLVTMPVTDWQIVLGKYLAGLGFLIVSLAMTLHFPLIVALKGAPDWGPIIGGYFGLLLIGAAYLAIGLMTSTWTRNQIVSFILSLLFCGFFFFIGKAVEKVWINMKPIFDYISFDYHFHNIERGVLDTRNIIYFVSLIMLCLVISVQSLSARKWRG